MKIPHAATKTQHSQINYYFLKKKKAGHKPTEARYPFQKLFHHLNKLYTH